MTFSARNRDNSFKTRHVVIINENFLCSMRTNIVPGMGGSKIYNADSDHSSRVTEVGDIDKVAKPLLEYGLPGLILSQMYSPWQ